MAIRENPTDTVSRGMTTVPRYIGIDILKLICAFMVVYLHTYVPGKIGDAVYMVCRIAVPIFLIITGFFYSDTVGREKVFVQLKKIFVLFLISNGLFFTYELLLAVFVRSDTAGFFKGLLTTQAITDFFIFNASPFSYHLWYMGAILYTLLIMAFAYKLRTKRILWFFIPILLAVDLILGDYSVIVFGMTFPVQLVRNFACVGIPYFLIGTWIREHYDAIRKKTSVMFWCLSSLLFTASTVAERYMLSSHNIAGNRKHNVSTTLLAISVFILFLMIFENRKLNRFTKILSGISAEYSTWIYIIHPFFIIILGRIASLLKVDGFYPYIRCIAVYIGTVVFLILAGAVRRHISPKRHRTQNRIP